MHAFTRSQRGHFTLHDLFQKCYNIYIIIIIITIVITVIVTPRKTNKMVKLDYKIDIMRIKEVQETCCAKWLC